MATLTASKPADLHIPKLTTSNYKVWSELTTEALKGRAVWEYTQGEVARPEDKEQLQIWVQNNAIASGIIKGTLSESQLGHVMGIESAKDVWDKLKTIHQSDGTARVRNLLGEFMRYRLVTTIDDGASTLTRIQNEIGNLKTASRPSEDMKIEALLASLGPEYEFIVAGIDVSDTTKYEDVVAKLRKAEARLKGQGYSQDQGYNQGHDQIRANLTTTGKGRKKGKDINQDNNDTDQEDVGKRKKCFHCGDTDHFIRDCEEFLTEIRRQILDEMGIEEDTQGPEKNHTAARMTGPPRRFKTATVW